jgi:hypothetical protein
VPLRKPPPKEPAQKRIQDLIKVRKTVFNNIHFKQCQAVHINVGGFVIYVFWVYPEGFFIHNHRHFNPCMNQPYRYISHISQIDKKNYISRQLCAFTESVTVMVFQQQMSQNNTCHKIQRTKLYRIGSILTEMVT